MRGNGELLGLLQRANALQRLSELCGMVGGNCAKTYTAKIMSGVSGVRVRKAAYLHQAARLQPCAGPWQSAVSCWTFLYERLG